MAAKDFIAETVYTLKVKEWTSSLLSTTTKDEEGKVGVAVRERRAKKSDLCFWGKNCCWPWLGPF